MTVMSTVFWDVMSCNFVDRWQHSEEPAGYICT